MKSALTKSGEDLLGRIKDHIKELDYYDEFTLTFDAKSMYWHCTLQSGFLDIDIQESELNVLKEDLFQQIDEQLDRAI